MLISWADIWFLGCIMQYTFRFSFTTCLHIANFSSFDAISASSSASQGQQVQESLKQRSIANSNRSNNKIPKIGGFHSTVGIYSQCVLFLFCSCHVNNLSEAGWGEGGLRFLTAFILPEEAERTSMYPPDGWDLFSQYLTGLKSVICGWKLISCCGQISMSGWDQRSGVLMVKSDSPFRT